MISWGFQNISCKHIGGKKEAKEALDFKRTLTEHNQDIAYSYLQLIRAWYVFSFSSAFPSCISGVHHLVRFFAYVTVFILTIIMFQELYFLCSLFSADLQSVNNIKKPTSLELCKTILLLSHSHTVVRHTRRMNFLRFNGHSQTRVWVYSSSSERRRALGFVTLMDSCCARSTMALRLRLDTQWAISAEKRRFCINSTSSSWKKEQSTGKWNDTKMLAFTNQCLYASTFTPRKTQSYKHTHS